MAEFEVNSVQEAQEKLKELDPEGKLAKPTPEEIKENYENFAKAVSDFNNKIYDIGTPEKFTTYVDYLLSFIEKKVFWTKQGWMGVIRLNQEITEAKEKAVGPLKLGYQALEFTYFALVNVGGIGLQTALDMEKEAELYAELIELLGKQLEAAREELKNVQFLQDKWAASEQGMYLEQELAKNEAEDAVQEMTIDVSNEPPTVSPD